MNANTERTIYRILDDEFTANGHTVVMIAHRLAGLEQYLVDGRDQAIVLADGRIQEVITDLKIEKWECLVGSME